VHRLRGELRNKPGTIFKVIYAKVLFHELAHAYMDSDQKIYIDNCSKVIEESLCNAISYQRFGGNTRAIVNMAISYQPLEYRCFTFWLEYYKGTVLREIAETWKNGELTWQLVNMTLPGDKLMHLEFATILKRLVWLHKEFSLDRELYWKYVGKRILEEM